MNVPVVEARCLNEADEGMRASVFSLRVMPWTVPSRAVSYAHTFFPRSMRGVTG